jgi:hypothetical protein
MGLGWGQNIDRFFRGIEVDRNRENLASERPARDLND